MASAILDVVNPHASMVRVAYDRRRRNRGDADNHAENTMASPALHHGLRIALAVVALVELADALSSVQNIFTNYHHQTARLRFAQALTSVKLALAPLVAGAAAALAVMGRTRLAIGALAALELLDWVLQDIWSIPFHGLELSLNFGGIDLSGDGHPDDLDGRS